MRIMGRVTGDGLYKLLMQRGTAVVKVERNELQKIANGEALALLGAISKLDGDATSITPQEFELAAERINQKFVMKQFVDFKNMNAREKVTAKDFEYFSKAHAQLAPMNLSEIDALFFTAFSRKLYNDFLNKDRISLMSALYHDKIERKQIEEMFEENGCGFERKAIQTVPAAFKDDKLFISLPVEGVLKEIKKLDALPKPVKSDVLQVPKVELRISDKNSVDDDEEDDEDGSKFDAEIEKLTTDEEVEKKINELLLKEKEYKSMMKEVKREMQKIELNHIKKDPDLKKETPENLNMPGTIRFRPKVIGKASS